MKTKACIVTGCNGDIGKTISENLKKNDFYVIGIDKKKKQSKHIDLFLNFDFNRIIHDLDYQKFFKVELYKELNKLKLELLINNAAVQHLTKNNADITKLIESYSVNSIAPYFLYKLCEKDLTKNSGTLINIGSIHASLSKKKFGFYASSKSALRSLNNSIAIDNNGKVLTYLIEPAAIDTNMLRRGFIDKNAVKELSEYHPCNSIGTPEEISKLIIFLHQSKIRFLHGTNIDLSGGIKSLLNDPG